MPNRSSLVLTLLLVAATFVAGAQGAPPSRSILVQRSEKIVATLNLSDPTLETRIATVIADQYEALAVIHARRDEKIAAAKALSDQASRTAAVAAARDEASAAQTPLRQAYLGRLAKDLSPEQIDKIKDGMTYGVVPLTFRVYQEMLPNLTAEQKQQIHAWLVEARDHAMDASTSEEKHGWFGKYKGRINNYLAAAGIDMKEAELHRSKHP